MKSKLIGIGAFVLLVAFAIVFIIGRDGWGRNKWSGHGQLVITTNGRIVVQPVKSGNMTVVWHTPSNSANPFRASSPVSK